MTRLYLPQSAVEERLREETREANAMIDKVVYRDGVCVEWTRELRRLDPLLSMVKAPDRWVVGLPLVPGAYHVLRRNEGAPWSLIPVRDQDGEPCQPSNHVLEQLKSMDMWNVDVPGMMKRIEDEQKRQRERDAERERDARREHMIDHFKKVTNASVSMNPDVPWTQNNSPAARRERAAAKKRRLTGS